MKISDYRKISGAYLKGRYGEAFVVTAACLFVFLTFKTAEALAIYAISDAKLSRIADAAITILRFIIMTPLITGGIWWFFRTVCGEDNSSLLKLYSGLRLNSRAALLYALMWSKGFFSLFPTAICFTVTYALLYGRIGLNGDVTVFAAFQSAMLGTVLIFLYFNALASMALAPFLFIDRPDSNPFGVIRRSSKLMKGHKLRFFGLLIGYIPVMLPIVTIPFVMPSAVMSAAAFAKDVIAESAENKPSAEMTA